MLRALRMRDAVQLSYFTPDAHHWITGERLVYSQFSKQKPQAFHSTDDHSEHMVTSVESYI